MLQFSRTSWWTKWTLNCIVYVLFVLHVRAIVAYSESPLCWEQLSMRGRGDPLPLTDDGYFVPAEPFFRACSSGDVSINRKNVKKARQNLSGTEMSDLKLWWKHLRRCWKRRPTTRRLLWLKSLPGWPLTWWSCFEILREVSCFQQSGTTWKVTIEVISVAF